MSVKKLGLALLFLCASTGAIADSTYVKLEQRLSAEQFKQTGLNTLAPEQLLLLNRLLSEQATHVTPVNAPMATEAAVVAAPVVAPIADTAATPSSFAGFDDGPVYSRVIGTIDGWQTGTVFNLENGQQWRVIKGKVKLYKPMTNPEANVKTSLTGRWFLQVDEDIQKALVTRIK